MGDKNDWQRRLYWDKKESWARFHSLHVKGQPKLTDIGKKELKFSLSHITT